MKFIKIVSCGVEDYFNLNDIKKIRFHMSKKDTCTIEFFSGEYFPARGSEQVELDLSFLLFIKSSEILWDEYLETDY